MLRGLHRVLAVVLVFGSSLLSGMAIVSFPGSSHHLVDTLGLSGEAYGRIFLPQFAFAVLGGLVGGRLTRRIGTRATLVLVLACQALSMAALYGATVVEGGYSLLLVATSLFGFSFGISGGPWSVLPPRLFPAAKDSAVASVYTVFGAGLTVGPLFLRFCTAQDRWAAAPLTIGGCALLAGAVLTVARMPALEIEPGADALRAPPLDRSALALFLAASFFYATIEAGLANWAIAFLTGDGGLSVADASVALSCFFGAFTAGRVVISALLLKVAPARIWALLPLGMVAALLSLPLANTPLRALLLYGLAGLSCSGHFPLSMTLSGTFFPSRVVAVSSWMFSALMAGIGLGAYGVGVLGGHASLSIAFRCLAVSPVVLLVSAILLGRRMTGAGSSIPVRSPDERVAERTLHVR